MLFLKRTEHYVDIDENCFKYFGKDDTISVVFNYAKNCLTQNFNNEKSVMLLLQRILDKLRPKKKNKSTQVPVKTYNPFRGEQVITLIKTTPN